jgi:hypothetical protein
MGLGKQYAFSGEQVKQVNRRLMKAFSQAVRAGCT